MEELCIEMATTLHSSRGTIPIVASAIGTPLSATQVIVFVNGTPQNCATWMTRSINIGLESGLSED